MYVCIFGVTREARVNDGLWIEYTLSCTQVCIEYEDADSCEKALKALMGRTFNNRPVIASFCLDRDLKYCESL